MKLYRTAKWYNPFSIDVNGKAYELGDIIFFDKDGEICHTDRGWFADASINNPFYSLEIPGDVKRKVKVDFNEKQAFIICAEHYGMKVHKLYIPKECVGLMAPTAVRSTMGDCHWEITWRTNIEGVSVTSWHFVDQHYRAIITQINNIGKELTELWSNSIEKFPILVAELQQKEDELNKEKERMLAITADDVLENYR